MEQKQPLLSSFEKYKRYYRSLEPFIEKPRNRAYATIVFSFLAISLFAWYAIRPTVQTILFLQRDITDKTVLNRQMEEKIQSLIFAQAAYEEVKESLPVINDAIPDNPDALPAILELKNLISTTQATLSSIQVSDIALVAEEKVPNTKIQPKSEFLLTLNVSGIYPEVETFLKSLTTMRRIVSINQVSFLPSKESSPQQPATGKIITLTVQLKAYYK